MGWIRCIAVLLIWSHMGGIEAQDLPFKSIGNLRFFVDLSAFRGPEGYTRQEVALLLDASQLQLREQEGEAVGKISLVAVVLDTLDNRVVHRTWVQQVAVPELDAGIGAPFKDAVYFDLKPGAYRLIVQIKDLHAEESGRCTVPLEIPDYERSRLVFSDIQLAFSVARSGEAHRFVKQGWKVVPNITRNYVIGEPLQIYFEVYNLSSSGESFIMGYRLIDAAGMVVRTYPAKRFLKPGESCVRAEILDTEGLREGTYDLQVEAFDGSSRQYFQTRRPIFLVSKDLPEGLTQVQRDLIGYYADIRYITDEKTQRVYDALEGWPARLAFLKVFWKQLDDVSDTPNNERLLQHLMRMHYVETHFGAGVRGKDTDRGRVYIQYGPPDDIDYRTSAAGQKPSEVWFYETHRRYEFVFRDRRGTGFYELVHSTYPGEMSNPYWWREF